MPLHFDLLGDGKGLHSGIHRPLNPWSIFCGHIGAFICFLFTRGQEIVVL